MQATHSVLRFSDIWRVGLSGPLARKSRTVLSALGVSIGIAALVGVLGLSESSKSALLDEISALGTNLLTVEAGQGFDADSSGLPETALVSARRADNVAQASAVWGVDSSVLKSEFISSGETGGISVVASDPYLLETLNGSVAVGRFFDDASGAYPAVVLGSVAAERLGIRSLEGSPMVYIGDSYVEVVGILEEFPFAADLDRAVIMGIEAAQNYYDAELSPVVVYVRVVEGTVDAVRELLPVTVNPMSPEEVEVSRPSDALTAQAAADSTLTTLFLGLSAVGLLIGGIGIANVMVIAVIERRGEIGLRRALGATRKHIRQQFLTEAVILSLLGGVVGVLIGMLVTYVYSTSQGWRVIIPFEASLGGLLGAVFVGAVAGLYPAVRAARLAPTEALRA